MADTQRVIWYFADPMCSWCWGFAPVISAIKDTYQGPVQLALMMGGLRPGTTQPMTPEQRAEILHHWQEVHRRSGQPFKFDGALPDGFVYDTEPACRAVITMLDLNAAVAFAYFKSIQAAFYAEGRDVTQTQMLAELAVAQGEDVDRFRERFLSEEMQRMTHAHFRQTAEIGIRGFPTVILQRDGRFDVLTYGYRPLEELKPKLEAWFADSASAE
jgi:putative protein-disulfide isomerase